MNCSGSRPKQIDEEISTVKKEPHMSTPIPIYIPERFKRVIHLHILKNMLVRPPAREPLFLGIHGPSGDGKTFQCEQVLEEMGVKAFLISGGQLEDHFAGEPAKLLRTTYLNAYRYVEKGGEKMAAIVMNDVETGVGKWEGLVQYTVNRQNVFGELMHLADYPYAVQGVQASRIPIIMTGNDFTKLYEPLVRAGRMTAFEWIPTAEEKARIIGPLFSNLAPKACMSLVEHFSMEPLAFFAVLRSMLTDALLYERIQRVGVRQIMIQARKGREPVQEPKVPYEELVRMGETLVDSGQLVNHLRLIS
jgi:ATP-dependent 26S proteasome regulatory subunit